MSMKDKRVKSVVESDDENEHGASGVSNDSRRFSLAVPENTPGSLLDESVDNLSMEVHLGGDSSCHPSEISSVSYQNLLDDCEPSNSIISRRGSDDSLDSYPLDFPDVELPPDDLETFEASDLPLSEHFPMGAIQRADSREKSRGDRSSYVSDNSSNISHQNVRLKDMPPADPLEDLKMREKNTTEPNLDTDEASVKRSSLEIRNNIPVLGEVKDYEKELNIDFSRVQGHKSTVIGLKQSPGVARRVDIETHGDRDSSGTEDIGKHYESTLPSTSCQQLPTKSRPKKTSSKSKENIIEVITPIPRNINVENEYDYVKYARVQQGNSYVGMRLAYSSSSDSLNIKQGVFSEDNSREPSPEKNLQQKVISDNGSQEKVCEETLMEIPLNNSDYPEDKKAFTLSPENTECDSVEVESVTSEGENSTPGFPTLEDGLSSSQASDVDEGASGVGNDSSPSKLIKIKQKASVEQDVSKKDEDCRPKEMDAQAIMNDLKMKREALDMAIADIKTAIQRSKSMSLESPYSNQTEPEGTQPVWVKRVNKEAANLAQRRQEEMRRVQEEIERQQEELVPSQGKSLQVVEARDAEDNILTKGQQLGSADTMGKNVQSEEHICPDATFDDNNISVILKADSVNPVSEISSPESETTTHHHRIFGDCTNELQVNEIDQALNADYLLLNDSSKHLKEEPSILKNCNLQTDNPNIQEPVPNSPFISSPDQKINIGSGTSIYQSTMVKVPHYLEHWGDEGLDTSQAADEIEHIRCEEDESDNILVISDTCKGVSKEEAAYLYVGSGIQTTSKNVILSSGSLDLDIPKVDNREAECPKQPHVFSLTFQAAACIQQFDKLVQVGESTDTGSCCSEERPELCVQDTISMSGIQIQSIKDVIGFEVDNIVLKSAYMQYRDDGISESNEHTEEKVTVEDEREENCVTMESDDRVGCGRLDGLHRGYDSDDECEDAEGIRYTRRIKGKKYAPLQKDDSLEMSGACAGSGRDAAKSNGLVLSSKHGSYLGSNGSLVTHKSPVQPQPESGETHIHSTEVQLSSEENSDIDANSTLYTRRPNADSDTDEETDRLLQKQYQERDKNVEIPELNDPAAAGRSSEAERRHSKAKEAAIRDPDRPEVLIEGVLFRARYLGSTQLISEGQPSKAMRMMQAQEAVGRIKTLGVLHFGERFQAPEGENQPSTDVDLFVSTEKIMVLNTDLQEIMMDHSLRTISYIADIGDILVIMARRRLITSPDDLLGRRRRQAKILCHVFESDEAQLIAQSIGQAFQVAYLEFLKANGIEDPGLLKEMDYQDVLNQQEIYGEELNLFANKDFHKEVIVPKSKNEPLGVVIVESGWGSMVPTVVLANMLPTGPAARCGQLNIGDQIISINGISLVGLPLSACQTYIKASRSQTVVKLTVVPCPPVVEVLIKRPDVKYQLGFSVQNGVICSLLRGGIAERGGVRVGHRIIEINNQSVVAVPHEKIVTLLANSVGEIHMKTMPTSIFRLLTGQDVPHYL